MYKNTTLISCGDSFTFGQGTIDSPGTNSTRFQYRQYKNECNRLSYSGVLGEKYFKNTINVGYPGASNEGIYQQLITVYDKVKNNDEDYFYLIALTSPLRDLIMTLSPSHNNKYTVYDYNSMTWLEQKENPSGWVKSSDILKMRKTTCEDIVSYYRNDCTLLLKHIIQYNAVVDFLKARNLKFAIFDLLNYAPSDEGFLSMIMEAGHPGAFKAMGIFDNDIFELYFRDLNNNENPYYLNIHNIKKYDKYIGTDIKIQPINQLNVEQYLIGYGEDVLGTKKKIASTVPGDMHWNPLGHEICADLLIDWIRKHYE